MKHADGKNQDVSEERAPVNARRVGVMGGSENNDPQAPDDAPHARARSPRDVVTDRADAPRDVPPKPDTD